MRHCVMQPISSILKELKEIREILRAHSERPANDDIPAPGVEYCQGNNDPAFNMAKRVTVLGGGFYVVEKQP